jgi:hypothetical protein
MDTTITMGYFVETPGSFLNCNDDRKTRLWGGGGESLSGKV